MIKIAQTKWKKILIIPIQALLFCLVASGGGAITSIVLNKGVGIQALPSFLFWTLPFAVVISGLSLVFLIPFSWIPRFASYGVAILFGVLVGILWTILISFLLGPWFRNFTFPVLFFWMAGGAGGLIVAAGFAPLERKVCIFSQLIFLILICLFASIISPLRTLISNELEITLVQGDWVRGPEELILSGLTEELTYEEKTLLKSTGLTGRINFDASGVYGTGKPVRVVMIMYRPVEASVDLAIPAEGVVIYVQNEGKWEMYPADALLSPQEIHLVASEDDPMVTDFWIEVSGGASGGTAFNGRTR